MPKTKDLDEYEMPMEIRKRAKNAGVPILDLKRVTAAIKMEKRKDPSRFAYASSIETLVQDITDTLVNRYKKQQQENQGRETAEGEWIPYPTGYEYAILVAARLKPLLKLIRKACLLPDAQPFTTFDEAVAWMTALHNRDLSEQQADPGQSTVSFELPADKGTELRSLLTKLTALQNQDAAKRDSASSQVDFDIEQLLNTLQPVLPYITLGNLRIVDKPPRSLTLFPCDDFKEEKGVSWNVVPGGDTAGILEHCETFIKRPVPEWDINKLFSYIMLGRLPILPTPFEKIGAGPGVIKFSFTVPYPMRDETLLRFYKGVRDRYNEPNSHHFNFNPPNLSEYDLVLLELVHKMPIEEFTWSQRLEKYLNLYVREINLEFLPDLGLTEPRNKISKGKWNNAAGNFGRDYKNVLNKLK